MRHRKKFNHLGRKSAHRKAMLKNMAVSLIEHKRINTTVAKAKELRVFVEPIINRSKTDNMHSRRMVFKKLQDKDAVNELFREVGTKIADRNGGYTRILKTGARLGDNAEMCIIELVDYNETYQLNKGTKTKKKRTRRSGGGSSNATQQKENTEKTANEEKEEVVAEQVKKTENQATEEEADKKENTDREK